MVGPHFASAVIREFVSVKTVVGAPLTLRNWGVELATPNAVPVAS